MFKIFNLKMLLVKLQVELGRYLNEIQYNGSYLAKLALTMLIVSRL